MKITRARPRSISFTKQDNSFALASITSEYGKTKVYITASVSNKLPPFLQNGTKGWITAEYSMLPGSTHSRTDRERTKLSGRTMEIQRLIGRSLRAVVDLEKLGPRVITLDCDCLVADGGTRTASISGAYVALELAIKKLIEQKVINEYPIKDRIAAISVGIFDQNIIADLDYLEDSNCSTDMNLVMTHSLKVVEIQGTAEKDPIDLEILNDLIKCGTLGLEEIILKQRNILE